MATALELFRPTEEALRQAGVEFVHPIEEVEEGNLQRRSKIVEYRAHMSKQEEVKIAAEREVCLPPSTTTTPFSFPNTHIPHTAQPHHSLPRLREFERG